MTLMESVFCFCFVAVVLFIFKGITVTFFFSLSILLILYGRFLISHLQIYLFPLKRSRI